MTEYESFSLWLAVAAVLMSLLALRKAHKADKRVEAFQSADFKVVQTVQNDNYTIVKIRNVGASTAHNVKVTGVGGTGPYKTPEDDVMRTDEVVPPTETTTKAFPIGQWAWGDHHYFTHVKIEWTALDKKRHTQRRNLTMIGAQESDDQLP